MNHSARLAEAVPPPPQAQSARAGQGKTFSAGQKRASLPSLNSIPSTAIVVEKEDCERKLTFVCHHYHNVANQSDLRAPNNHQTVPCDLLQSTLLTLNY